MKTKGESIEQIGELVEKLSARFSEEDIDEQKWMRDQCSPEAQQVLATITVQALHLIARIPDDAGESVNIVGISRATGVPKGTVSKIVQRLVDGGAVVRHRREGNRKEVHLRLTEVGEEIQRAHRSLHEQMGDGLATLLMRYSESDLAVITRVLSDLLRMPREGVRFRPDLLN
ncbi:MarR family winged helix-turn-helix transcriptional regulator [Paramicrobacterium chengjingii]|uniref:Winged helix DNA-binding protein n=1 Tax=Paramicrobacterium chengjingii TaxID=2769067 RepID=A0ABX6YIN5_9MICO|nr:MarR family transcriptional regulator [Microbacterium chengjingii]QPZ38616.1 winged helix DNA-binding protein [Microbacterium chengjingii]